MRNANLTSIVVLLAAITAAPVAMGSTITDEVFNIEREEGALSMKLYQPLRRLGLDLLASGRTEDAIDTFRRMQHLVHRTDGVYSPHQIDSVELLIRGYQRLKDARNLEVQHRFIYDVADRNFDDNHPRMIEAHTRLGTWYRNTARYDDALAFYANAREGLAPDDTYNQVKVLRAEALTLYLAGRCCASARLAEVERMVREGDGFDFEERKRAAFDLADMLMIERDLEAADDAYRTADSLPGRPREAALLGARSPREVLSAIRRSTMRFSPAREVIEMPDQDNTLFGSAAPAPLPPAIGEPVPVCSSTVQNVLRRSKYDVLDEYFLDVDLTIDEKGRARNIETDGNVPVALARYVRLVLTESRYRPGLSGGKIAPTSKVSFRQTFSTDGTSFVGGGLADWNRMMTSQACKLAEYGAMTASAD